MKTKQKHNKKSCERSTFEQQNDACVDSFLFSTKLKKQLRAFDV